MKKKTINSRAKEEQARLYNAISGLASPAQLAALEPVIENVAWMRVELDAARVTIGEQGVAVPYDNGGGQTGIRQNPLFAGYSALWKSYMMGLKEILALVPTAAPELPKPETPQNVLTMIQGRHKKNA